MTQLIPGWERAHKGQFDMTLYLDLGGRPALKRSTERLIIRLQQDPIFAKAPPACPHVLKEDLTEFLVFLFGGAPFYEGHSAEEMLHPYCYNDRAFDAFVEHVIAVLIDPKHTFMLEQPVRCRLSTLREAVLYGDRQYETMPAAHPLGAAASARTHAL